MGHGARFSPAGMVEWLTATGELSDQAWKEAFLAVPRHLFVPGHDLARAYSDGPVVLQQRTVHTPDGHPLQVATSSVSAPSVVAMMLERLRVRDGMRVLEIGTGSGYNAALMAHRLGGERVQLRRSRS